MKYIRVETLYCAECREPLSVEVNKDSISYAHYPYSVIGCTCSQQGENFIIDSKVEESK